MTISPNPQPQRSAFFLRVRHKSTEAIIKVDLRLDLWNFDKKEFMQSKPGGKGQHAKLLSLISKLTNIWNERGYTDAKQLKAHYDGAGADAPIMYDKESTQAFIEHTASENGFYHNRNLHVLKKVLDQFEPNIPLTGWSKPKLEEFKKYLASRPTITSQNTIARYLKDLRATLNKAIYLDRIGFEHNPFNKGAKIELGATRDIKLTMTEFQALYALRHRFRAAQVWLLCFFLDGARIGEVLELTWDNIEGGEIWWTVSKKRHTVVQKRIPISPELREIIDLINPQRSAPYLCAFRNKAEGNVPSWNARLNAELKEVARWAKIKKRLIFHAARNTFAYLASSSGYDITEIQEALKHTNVQITRNYIGRLQDDRLNDKRKGLVKKLLK